MEAINQVERVITTDTGQIEKLGENQRDQNRKCRNNGKARQMRSIGWAPAHAFQTQQVALIPTPSVEKNKDAQNSYCREPGNFTLTSSAHDDGGKKWPERLPGVAANLKQGLSETVTASGGHPRKARRLRMKDR